MHTPRLSGLAVFLGAVVFASVSGCSGDESATGGQAQDVGGVGNDTAGTLDGLGDDAVDAAEVAQDVAPDVAEDSADAAEDTAIVWPEPEACSKNEECVSGFCLPTPDGKFCAPTCVQNCPPEFSCKEYVSSSDVVFVCTHQAPYRCTPCASDADCKTVEGQSGVCRELGASGYGFCLQACDPAAGDAGCVGEGYQCKADGADADGKGACHPPQDVCPCPEGKQGACNVKNEHGACPGTFVCGADGPGVCTGTAPVAEICNGKDENCNGEVDEGVPAVPCELKNVYGTCQGQTLCVGGKELCQGTQASAEVCNGIDDNCSGVTDEGFTDTDGDKQADCVDEDDDGDGVDDEKDVCPLAADPSQTDTDSDGQGDACDGDDDGDGVPDLYDLCPLVADPKQKDTDGDTKGDACDEDDDGDGVPDAQDVCPLAVDPSQTDSDKDGIGDLCDDDVDGDGVANGKDNCPGKPNANQADDNDNGIGDVCEDDWDGDGVLNAEDNCAWVINPSQADQDKDKIGDACDCDLDGDGVANVGPGCAAPTAVDNCPLAANASQTDFDFDGKGDECDPDADGDGDANINDCAPMNPKISSKAQEACNNVDDDCDDEIDENDAKGCEQLFYDGDADGYGVSLTVCACKPKAPYTAKQAGDCNDKDAAVQPDAQEICGNGKDDNCNGSENDQNAKGCNELYYDADGDGFGTTLSKCLCAAAGFYSAKQADDCNDNDLSMSPQQSEKCGNSKDDDCNGKIDEPGCVGCTVFYEDKDGDGFGTAVKLCLSEALEPFTAEKGGDCDDGDKAASPGVAETCNGKDDDCDGATDEVDAVGCTPLYADGDKDGFGTGVAVCACKAEGTLTATKDGDCDDKDDKVHPDATELCGNGKDDNCSGAETDKDATGCTVYYEDGDGDGVGTANKECLCAPAGAFTAKQTGDCDDKDPGKNPNLTEQCKDNKDNNCNGKIDEAGCLGCQQLLEDADGDGFGVTGKQLCLGAPSYPYTAFVGGDCDDKNPNVKPGAAETCNDIDDNCDGSTDPAGSGGCANRYPDEDEDGYGANVASTCTCKPVGKVTATKAGDCNDALKAVNPGAVEVCNEIDDNCNSQVDEGVKLTFYKDNDGDGVGSVTSQQACKAPTGYTAESGDCNDFNKNIKPGATEICNDIDDDCDGQLDQGVATADIFTDVDGDGFGSANAKAVKKCLYEGGLAPAGYATNKLDCDDSKSTVYPGAPELCDGILNNCGQAVADAHCPTKCEGAWPVFLGGSAGFPVIAQLDGDNNLELVARNEGKVRAIKHDGTILWEQSASVSYSYPAMGRMNNDSTLDLVSPEHDGKVRIWDGSNGNQIANFAGTTGRGWYGASVFDIDRDGVPDIVPVGSAPMQILLLKDNLTLKQQINLPTALGEPIALAPPGLWDVDGDGVVEIFFGSGSWGCAADTTTCKGIAYLYASNGTLLSDPTWGGGGKPQFVVAGWPKTYAGEGRWPMLADFDGDGVVEIHQHFTGSSSHLWKLDGTGHPANGKTPNSGFPILAPLDSQTGKLRTDASLVDVGGPAVDIDGDGLYEVITGGSGVSVVRQGKVMDGFPLKLSAGPIMVGDVNRDGKLDILFISGSNNSLNCYSLGEGTYSDTRVLHPGSVYGLSRGNSPTLSHDPFEPNDVRGKPFDPTKTTNPLLDSRAFRISALRDVFSSGGGWTHKLQAMLGSKGDRDYYVLYGGIINLSVVPSVIDVDVYVHAFKSDGTFVETRKSTNNGTSTDSVTCHSTNNCPAGISYFIIEVRGKDETKDFGPWPYWLTTNWAQ